MEGTWRQQLGVFIVMIPAIWHALRVLTLLECYLFPIARHGRISSIEQDMKADATSIVRYRESNIHHFVAILFLAV